jgi:hypothetical protein
MNVISGIKIPDSKIAREAAELVRQHEDEMLFNIPFVSMSSVRSRAFVKS